MALTASSSASVVGGVANGTACWKSGDKMARIPPRELNFLRDLRDSTNFAGWNSVNRRGWHELGRRSIGLSGAAGDPVQFLGCCGVKAEFTDRRGVSHISSIDLHNAHLGGPLPPTLFRLEYLTYLDLRDNELSGELPERWPEELETVLLYRNRLTGSVPPGMGRMKKLVVLQMWENDLEGELPPEVCSWQCLRVLYLGRNRLSGPLPRHLGRLHAMRRLWLEHNQFEGHLPKSIAKLKRLQWLKLEGNRFDAPPSIGELEALMGQLPGSDEEESEPESSDDSSSDDGGLLDEDLMSAEALARLAAKRKEKKNREAWARAATRARRISMTTTAFASVSRRFSVMGTPQADTPGAGATMELPPLMTEMSAIDPQSLFSEEAAVPHRPRKITI